LYIRRRVQQQKYKIYADRYSGDSQAPHRTDPLTKLNPNPLVHAIMVIEFSRQKAAAYVLLLVSSLCTSATASRNEWQGPALQSSPVSNFSTAQANEFFEIYPAQMKRYEGHLNERDLAGQDDLQLQSVENWYWGAGKEHMPCEIVAAKLISIT
jgi:hypothetical protein